MSGDIGVRYGDGMEEGDKNSGDAVSSLGY